MQFKMDRDLIDALQTAGTLPGSPDLRIAPDPGADGGFDAVFQLRAGGTLVRLFIEAKARCTAASIAALAPWIRRTRELLPGASVALLCESLSRSAQEFCIENEIDYIDLMGNISINVPGVLLIRRTGSGVPRRSAGVSQIQNPFSGRSSRVVRVLLENPRPWRGKTIADELRRESTENAILQPGSDGSSDEQSFVIDAGSISRVIRRLEDDLLVRRRAGQIFVPEPERLLLRWAERYTERYRWRLRRSFLVANPFGSTLADVGAALPKVRYAFTGVAAAAASAPWVEAETIDLYVASNEESTVLREISGAAAGPRLRVIFPYDRGVFMYARRDGPAAIVSPIQSYLDAWAAGGRERNQAEYLLETAIGPKWQSR